MNSRKGCSGMNEREQVKRGLQCIIDGTVRCESCGYAIDKHGHHSCQQNCASDALALLKEQEPVKVRHLHGTKVTVHEEIVFTDECENCSGYLLKHWKACPICGKPVK